MNKIIKREVIDGTFTTIEGRNRKVLLWIEHAVDESGKEYYTTRKQVIFKENPSNPKLLSVPQPDIPKRLN